MHRRWCIGLAGSLLISALAQAQASGRSLAAALKPYTDCRLPAGPDVVDVTPLPGTPMTRTVDTLRGPRNVLMVDGARVMFAYPNTDFYANLKVEQLEADRYETNKADLISAEDKLLAADDANSRNYLLKPKMHGFEIYGIDRKKLEGGVLGVYLLFDDPAHVATTIYFLNQEPGRRRFDDMAGYTKLRDSFLETYTSCVRSTITPSK
jgi:hypothetical protein